MSEPIKSKVGVKSRGGQGGPRVVPSSRVEGGEGGIGRSTFERAPNLPSFYSKARAVKTRRGQGGGETVNPEEYRAERKKAPLVSK